MATTIKSEYLGNLRCESTHVKSGNLITTDAPTDNHGKGESFSPTDLLATSLLTCMMTVIGIEATKRNLDIGNLSGEVEKIMVSAPRKIGKLRVRLDFEGQNLSKIQKNTLQEVALNCPVALSLSPEIIQETNFHYS